MAQQIKAMLTTNNRRGKVYSISPKVYRGNRHGGRAVGKVNCCCLELSNWSIFILLALRKAFREASGHSSQSPGINSDREWGRTASQNSLPAGNACPEWNFLWAIKHFKTKFPQLKSCTLAASSNTSPFQPCEERVEQHRIAASGVGESLGADICFIYFPKQVK